MSCGKFLHAYTLEWFNGRYERLVRDRKQNLLGSLSGHIVEIGAGTGPNLRYYPAQTRLTAVEPNPHMHRFLRRKAAQRALHLQVRQETGERLPLPDECADAVVTTLVLCSVSHQPTVLAEIRRILKPGGKFVFVEHVAGEHGSKTRGRQERVLPYWKFFADGCCPNRETWAAIDAAGFGEVTYERFSLDLPIVGPHMAGVAVK